MKSILSAVVGATLALSAIEADAQATPGERQVSLTIESTSLATALDKWAQQSGFQIFVQDWEGAKNLPARSLKGTFTAQDALEQLLAGTSLTYVWISDKAVSIRKKMPQTVPTALQRTGLDGQQSIPVAKFSGDGAMGFAAAESSGGSLSESVPTKGSIDEVIVTGTSIRGVTPAGSPLSVFTREDISKTGSGSVREFMRKVPQNFSLTDQETLQNNGNSQLADINIGRGTAVNLHGLGSGSTLTLLDGQRLAPSGVEGSFVDVSLIPLAAVERVEMLTDGASAIYGADAVAGVVNFVLRHDFEGGETSVRYGDSSQGGGAQLTVSQLLGTSWDDGNALLVYEHQRDDSVDAKERDFIPPIEALIPGPFTIFPQQRRNSVIGSMRQGFTQNFEVSARGFFSQRDFEEDASTFAGFSHVDGNVKSAGGNLAAKLDVFTNWSVTAAADYSTTKQRSVVTSDPGDLSEAELESKSSGIDVRLSGALFDIGDASARASIGVSARREKFDAATAEPGDLDRSAKSAYAEVFAPLIAPSADTWVHRLEVSLAGRVDDYDDFGSSGFKPKVGIALWPTASLGFRASWSESFRAPLLSQMDTSTASPFRWLVLNLPDPASQAGVTPTIIPLVLGNPDLEPETAESLTVGLDVTPESLPNFRASLTYYDIDYTDRVSTPPLQGNLFLLYQQAAELAPFIDGSPDPAEIARFYSEGVLNPFGVPADQVAAHYDGRNQNIASMRTSGFELAFSNTFETGVGAFAPFIDVNYITRLDTRAASTTPEQELFDKIYTPARLKMHGGLSWSRLAISTTLSASYINDYENNTLAPPADIDAWVTFDWHLQYDASERNANALLRGLSLALDVQNLTDEDPPHVTVPTSLQTFDFGYDATNASAMGRFISLQVIKRW